MWCLSANAIIKDKANTKNTNYFVFFMMGFSPALFKRVTSDEPAKAQRRRSLCGKMSRKILA
jgi:hypothetical protein